MGEYSKSSHIESLDGIRAVSITLVFVAHCGFGHFVPGGFGVTIFFFLSGYLITRLLCREWEGHGQIALGAFYMRRALRLGPPLIVTLACAMALVIFGHLEGRLESQTLLSQILFVWNYYSLYVDGSGSIKGLGILWSLAVEEHFYLIWPTLFILIARKIIGLRGLGLLILAILLWRFFRFFVWGDSEWVIYISTDTRFDSLLFGCLLALMHWQSLTQRLFAPNLQWPWVLAGLGILLACLIIREDWFRSTLRYSLQGLGLMPLFHYAVKNPGHLLFQPLNWKPVRRIGQWSYTMYLCHLVIIHALVQNGLGSFGDPRLILISAPLSIGFSAAVYYWFEKPLHPLRRRLTGHPAPAS